MFVDTAKIIIKAGDGGNGAVSFHREKYVAAGGPDGGDGGKGGDIIFRVDDNMSTLADFRYKRKYSAKNGGSGGSSRCYGKSGESTVIKVPRGTLIKESETGLLLCDMSSGEDFVAAKGGRGGWGNRHFANSTRQCPRFSKSGAPGEELEVTLELKLLADVGLVGFPNVGKSTFISVVSDAKPKIANYHFTTLTPVLGVVRVDEGRSYVIADIPGIIEGASEGVGLGHEFLRHIDRCRLLVHVVDVSGSEGRDPISDFEQINSELQKYSGELAERPQIVVANKCDMCDDDTLARFRTYIEDRGFKFASMIAPIAEGTEELKLLIASELDKLPPITVYEPDERPVEPVDRHGGHDFTVTKADDDYYIVEAPWLLRILDRVDMDDYESLQYFQSVLQKTGIIKELKRLGINEGDTVSIYDFEFDFVL